MRFWPLAVIVALCTVGTATVSLGGSPYGTAKDPHVIKVSDSGFEPSALTIQKGEVVRWEWDSGSHVVTSGESPDSEDAGELFAFPVNSENRQSEPVTFAELGTFPFFDAVSPGSMRGEITVIAATPVNLATWGKLKSLFERP